MGHGIIYCRKCNNPIMEGETGYWKCDCGQVYDQRDHRKPKGLLNPVKDEAIVGALQAVLGEDAQCLGQPEVDCVKTVIMAFLWSKESDTMVREVVERIKDDMAIGLGQGDGDEDETLFQE